MRWIGAGIAGWIAAIVPLLVVNIAGYANVFDADTAVLAGAVALVGSVLLGGIVSGALACRQPTSMSGGASAALSGGAAAALLYVVSLIVVVRVAVQTDAAPQIVAEHPIRIAVAILCLGALLLGIALLTGLFLGRRGRIHAASATRQLFGRTQPSTSTYSAGARSAPQDAYPGERGFSGQESYNSRGNSVGAGYDDGRGRNARGYDERQPTPQRGDGRAVRNEREQDRDWR
jgi:hypothetical protein